MRVLIRKYPEYYSSYKVIKSLFFWAVKDDTPPKWVMKIAQKYINTKIGVLHDKLADKLYDWQERRRVNVKIDKWDLWNVDFSLSYIILPILYQLKENKRGSPFIDIPDRPKHLIPENILEDEYHFEAWDWALDEMIFAFKSILEEECGEGLTEQSQLTSDEWDEMDNRVKNGLILFGKYYRSLWT